MLSIDHLNGVSVAPRQVQAIRGALANQLDAVQTPGESLAGTWPSGQLYSELTDAQLGRSSVLSVILDIHDSVHIAEGLVRQAQSLEYSRDSFPGTIYGLIAGVQADQKRRLSDRLIELCLDSGDHQQQL